MHLQGNIYFYYKSVAWFLLMWGNSLSILIKQGMNNYNFKNGIPCEMYRLSSQVVRKTMWFQDNLLLCQLFVDTKLIYVIKCTWRLY